LRTRCGRIVGIVREDVKDARPRISSRLVMVAWRYASVTAKMARFRRENKIEHSADWNNAWKSAA